MLRKIRPKKVFGRFFRASPKREALFRALRVPKQPWGPDTLQRCKIHILRYTHVEISVVRSFSDANAPIKWLEFRDSLFSDTSFGAFVSEITRITDISM